jgi:hypothetical protein
MLCDQAHRQSFLVRLWAESDDRDAVIRGSIQNVQTGHKTFFDSIELPLELLRDSAERLARPGHRSQIA